VKERYIWVTVRLQQFPALLLRGHDESGNTGTLSKSSVCNKAGIC